ncbi:MAG: hypothetical protein K9M55_07070 [Candidatus Marinimicrobia bacterium]|nr:hypothetical protein [Candidatus Neomarinimicrobiota bacterium]
MNKLKLIPAFYLIAMALAAQGFEDIQNKSKIADTPHNLMINREAVMQDNIVVDFSLCRYCHVPNKATAVEPLWYRKISIPRFDLNKELDPTNTHVHPLDPGSRHCLSCHDGSMARSFPHRGDQKHPQVNLTAPEVQAPANYNMHLFNFPASGKEISRPDESSELLLTDQNQVSCITCHDPHNNEKGHFLRVSNQGSEICMECHHMQNWELSTHGNPQNPLHADLEKVACLQCHEIHSLPTNAKLLRADENTLCLSCHDGSSDEVTEFASTKNLEEVFEKPFTHPIRINPNVTDVGYEADTDSPWNFGLADDRFVRCGDCHNPHAVTEKNISPVLDGSLAFSRGVDAIGFPKDRVDYEYEVCYQCHGQNQNVRSGNDVGRLLSVGNRSYHPIENIGLSSSVPSLKDGWSEQSLITCSDCHGNDDPYGPQGPHGSSLPHILKAPYSDFPYASIEDQQLCFKCHDQRKIVGDEGFKFHNLHINRAGYSCSACHNPHGSFDSPGLIDLTQSHITSLNGEKKVEGLEPGHGTCTLQCHNVKHVMEAY